MKEISRSRQFHVICDDDNARGAIATACDQIKERLLRLLDQRDQWKYPIVVVVRVPLSTEVNVIPWKIGVYRAEDGTKLQLDLNITEGLEKTRLTDRVIEAVLTEFAYRNRNTFMVESNYQRPYPWLVAGLAERITRIDNPFPSTLITAILQASSKVPFRKLLARSPENLDSVSLEIYRAYAMSVLEMFLSQPGGRAGLIKFIKGIPTRRPEQMFDFATDFPELGDSPESVDKWWAVSLAKMTTADQYLPMTPDLTETKLNSVLVVRIPESYFEKTKPKPKKKEKGKPKKEPEVTEEPLLEALPTDAPAIPGTEEAPETTAPVEKYRTLTLDQFREFSHLPKDRLKGVMGGPLTGLYALSATAHPMYYAILAEYQRIAGLMAEGKFVGLEKDLARMAEVRAEVLKLYSEIDDYMNWVEATQIEVRSGTFDNYLKEAKAAEKAKERRKDDPINQYLDIIEAEVKAF